MSIEKIMQDMNYGLSTESDKDARKWLTAHDALFGLFIDGTFQKPNATDSFETIAPATGEGLAKISKANQDDINSAIRAARSAQPKWAALSGSERGEYLYAIARHLQKHARLFAVLESMDNGKTIHETRDIDIPLAIRHFYYHAGWSILQENELADFEPLGVCAQIIPWNFPLLMLAWKIAPAIALGNTVVLKPAEETPLTALLFAEICQEIGLPKGVVNIITGDGETGAWLTAAEGIDKIAFTGSTEVGKLITDTVAGKDISLTLELGGKSPFIVFQDADLDSAVEGIVDSIWFNQGQVCCAGSRLLVQESISERFVEKLTARLQNLRIGSSLDKSADIGPVISQKQCARIDELVQIAVANGARLAQPEHELPEHGAYFPPTILADLEPANPIADVEIFGPVLSTLTFRTPDEAIALANQSRYGLAANIWSENINLALDIAPKLRAGVVWINTANQFDAAAGFGGVKESGYGREGGKEGLYSYLRPKSDGKKTLSSKATKPTATPRPILDTTEKLYIGGKQTRSDSGYSYPVFNAKGAEIGLASLGSRKDVRNAVEAAEKASGWAGLSGFHRSQILYFIAENFARRRQEFETLLSEFTGKGAAKELDDAYHAMLSAAAWADKYDGQVHNVPIRGVALAMKEPAGILGIVTSETSPFADFVNTTLHALALGNRVVAVANEVMPLSATLFYQVLETSDLPGGALNILTGPRQELGVTLAKHLGVDALWYHGAREMDFDRYSSLNVKHVWNYDTPDTASILRHATEVKNIWIPYGE